MLPYWILLFIPAFFAAFERPGRRGRTPGLFCFGFFLFLSIGFRYEVGGDWTTYERMLYQIYSSRLIDSISITDPAYAAINWFTAQINQGVWLVNTICAFLFSITLIHFARNQPRPWLAITIAIPYLVIVVAMGYTRQAVAIGFLMTALIAASRGRLFTFVFWIAIAATFHRTAIVMLPVGILASSPKSRLWSAIWMGMTGAILFYTFLHDDVGKLMQNYIIAQYDSKGAFIRLMMNLIPALALLLYRRKIVSNMAEWRLWTYISLIAIGLFVLFFIVPSSTAIDRIALYIIPIQIYTLNRLPGCTAMRSESKIIVFSIILYCALIQVVWLFFATHSHAWLPYQTIF